MNRTILILMILAYSLTGCSHISVTKHVHNPYQPIPYIQLQHPSWSKDATIYQINTRQFTKQGTIHAAEQQLPRLQQLGVNILWLMPIQPIGVLHRKGRLGSPYSIKDYYAVNPELGTLADLKQFVHHAHQLGMHVILDWVANHTAWDNQLVTEHPEWYEKDYQGHFTPTPWWDWSDVIDLNYDRPGLRKYMTEAMKYWIKVADVDGYRADVAGFVPVDFWNNVRAELDKIKPVFMLAEWESRDLHKAAFDMTYAWSWYDAVHQIAQGQANLNKLFVYYSWNQSAFPKDAYRMVYTSNHDVNAWENTMYQAFGKALNATTVLQFTGQGLPLIYNGQEAGNAKRLNFFERDPIHWQASPLQALYHTLIQLKKQYSALWNGHWGATMVSIVNNVPMKVLSFVRKNQDNGVFVVINFTDQPQTVNFKGSYQYGQYNDWFTKQPVQVNEGTHFTLKPWQFKLLTWQKHH